MLPAIYFIFSRRGCDKAVANLKDLSLVNYKEANLINEKLSQYIKNNQEGIKDQLNFEAIKRGIASHHAGQLPAWKELVEELFQMGLIKVVFATETLAAGINMPARTTIISSLSKRTENGHRLLFSSEFLQMSGRAGRRGKDTQGYVVTVQSRFEGAKEASILATSQPNPLVSQFTPSYGMVLNLLQNYSIEKSRELIKRSFGSFVYLEESANENLNLNNLNEELNKLRSLTLNISWEDFDKFEKLKSRIKEERRILKILEKQASKRLSEEIINALKFLEDGSFISIKAPQLNRKIVPAIICKKQYDNKLLKGIICLTLDNSFILIRPSFVVNIFPDIDKLNILNLNIPEINFSGEVLHGDDNSRLFVDKIEQISKSYDLKISQYNLANEVVNQKQLINKLDDQIIKHPAYEIGDFKKLKRYRKRILSLELEINERNKLLEEKENFNWKKFTDLVQILNHFGCLNEYELTEIGKSISTLRTENELWLGLVLLSGYLDELNPPDLASVIQGICVDVRRPDLWCNNKPSAKVYEVFNEINIIKKLISAQQNKYTIDNPLYLEKDLTGIISEWAKGKKWKEVVFNTSLDEGDVVRIIRRTIDILSQIQYCVGVSNKLKNNAKLAFKLINRFPVAESQDLTNISQNNDINPATKRIEN